eukprot:g1371.t1
MTDDFVDGEHFWYKRKFKYPGSNDRNAYLIVSKFGALHGTVKGEKPNFKRKQKSGKKKSRTFFVHNPQEDERYDVFFAEEGDWYTGTVAKIIKNPYTAMMKFDDGDEFEVNFRRAYTRPALGESMQVIQAGETVEYENMIDPKKVMHVGKISLYMDVGGKKCFNMIFVEDPNDIISNGGEGFITRVKDKDGKKVEKNQRIRMPINDFAYLKSEDRKAMKAHRKKMKQLKERFKNRDLVGGNSTQRQYRGGSQKKLSSFLKSDQSGEESASRSLSRHRASNKSQMDFGDASSTNGARKSKKQASMKQYLVSKARKKRNAAGLADGFIAVPTRSPRKKKRDIITHHARAAKAHARAAAAHADVTPDFAHARAAAAHADASTAHAHAASAIAGGVLVSEEESSCGDSKDEGSDDEDESQALEAADCNANWMFEDIPSD